ncbi:MAG: hypothetical protein JOZ17_07950 [Acetobacteraceae bacterium]|nr:hypothetical protein [Acetobacteraceae bacterium]
MRNDYHPNPTAALESRPMRPGPPPILYPLALVMLVGAAEPRRPDDFLTRIELLAVLETLNADLLSHPSATLTLERWCGAHHLAPEAKLTARLVRGADKALPAEDRHRLALSEGEPVRYRRVQLFCGERMLSEADNWYVPGRLTPEMNRLLDETDTPFGRVVRDLDFHRETLSATLLWSPLPEEWDTGSLPTVTPGSELRVPGHVLEHRAILYTRAHVPFSEVVETYTGEVLAFPLPAEK